MSKVPMSKVTTSVVLYKKLEIMLINEVLTVWHV